jgi:PAS domain S-box-containing protein
MSGKPDAASASEIGEDINRRRLLFFIITLCGGGLAVDYLGRLLLLSGHINVFGRDILGTMLYLGVTIVTVRVALIARSLHFVRRAILISISLIVLAQVINLIEDFPIARDIPILSRDIPLHVRLEQLLFSLGYVIFVASCLAALVEGEAARRQLLRERKLLAANIERRRQAEEDLQRAKAGLEEAVRSRTAELEGELHERLAAERALLESEARLKAVFENQGLGMFTVDRRGRLQNWNRRWAELVEVRDPALDGFRLESLAHPEDLAQVLVLVDELFKGTRESLEVAARVQLAEGRYIWTRLTASVMEYRDGKPWLMLGVVADITEARLAEDRRMESTRLLEAAISSAPIVIWSIDDEGYFTLSEGSGLEAIGAKPGDVVGASLFELYAGYPAIVSQARDALAGRSSTQLTQLGSLVFRSTYSPMRDEHGVITGAIGVAVDVTKETHLEAQIRRKQKMEAIGTLASGIAHDFNNILYAITGFNTLLKRRCADDADALDYIAEIENAASRAADLVERILAFSARREQPFHQVDFGEEVQSVARLLRGSLMPNIELRLDIAPDLQPVLGDPSQIEQLLLNLCTNALHSMAEHGGVLTIQVDMTEIAEGARMPPGRYVQCRVADTGVGIPSDLLEQIFEPFYTTRSVGQGTGLGMAIVDNVVRAHGGTILVESEPGRGTVFTTMLPAMDPAAPVPSSFEHPAPRLEDIPPQQVLFVDDEGPVRMFAELLFEGTPHKMITCASAMEALACFEAAPDDFDLVLVDLYMPGLSGIDLCRSIAALRPGTPVVVCSGRDDAQERESAAAAGAVEFLKKPISIDKFTSVLSLYAFGGAKGGAAP